jgi:hypothetical protein
VWTLRNGFAMHTAKAVAQGPHAPADPLPRLENGYGKTSLLE